MADALCLGNGAVAQVTGANQLVAAVAGQPVTSVPPDSGERILM